MDGGCGGVRRRSPYLTGVSLWPLVEPGCSFVVSSDCFRPSLLGAPLRGLLSLSLWTVAVISGDSCSTFPAMLAFGVSPVISSVALSFFVCVQYCVVSWVQHHVISRRSGVINLTSGLMTLYLKKSSWTGTRLDEAVAYDLLDRDGV